MLRQTHTSGAPFIPKPNCISFRTSYTGRLSCPNTKQPPLKSPDLYCPITGCSRRAGIGWFWSVRSTLPSSCPTAPPSGTPASLLCSTRQSSLMWLWSQFLSLVWNVHCVLILSTKMHLFDSSRNKSSIHFVYIIHFNRNYLNRKFCQHCNSVVPI